MSASAKRLLAALAAGFVFGLGLVVSDMVNPARVIGFLDVAGKWDATLLMVMIGALAVSIPGFRWILKRPHPLCPGPAVTALVTLAAPFLAFFVAMLAGAFAYDRFAGRKA